MTTETSRMPDPSEPPRSEQSQKPSPEPAAEVGGEPADAQEPRVVTWWGLVFVGCTAVWAFVVLAYVAHVGTDVSGIAAVLAAILPLVLPRVESLRLPKGALSAILMAEVAVIGVWGGIRLYLDHRPLNALSSPSRLDLTRNSAVPVDQSFEARLHLAGARDHLRVTFHITNVNEATQCAVETRLTPTLSRGGSMYPQSEVADRQPLRIDLKAHVQDVELSVQIANRAGDHNCKVTISVVHASAYDWPWLHG